MDPTQGTCTASISREFSNPEKVGVTENFAYSGTCLPIGEIVADSLKVLRDKNLYLASEK